MCQKVLWRCHWRLFYLGSCYITSYNSKFYQEMCMWWYMLSYVLYEINLLIAKKIRRGQRQSLIKINHTVLIILNRMMKMTAFHHLSWFYSLLMNLSVDIRGVVLMRRNSYFSLWILSYRISKLLCMFLSRIDSRNIWNRYSIAYTVIQIEWTKCDQSIFRITEYRKWN